LKESECKGRLNIEERVDYKLDSKESDGKFKHFKDWMLSTENRKQQIMVEMDRKIKQIRDDFQRVDEHEKMILF